MRAEDIVGILKGHIDPRSYDDSCNGFSDCDIRYLKNVGLLDCYYDYGSNREMVFTTGSGMRYIEIYDGNADLDDLRDIVYVGKDLSSNEYIDAVKKAVGARTDRRATWPLGVFEDGPERSNHIVQAAGDPPIRIRIGSLTISAATWDWVPRMSWTSSTTGSP